jgi:hypothetical protein
MREREVCFKEFSPLDPYTPMKGFPHPPFFIEGKGGGEKYAYTKSHLWAPKPQGRAFLLLRFLLGGK